MGFTWKSRLWKHQAQAVETVWGFLERYRGPRSENIASALVNIPTGGGKTAVIGAVAHWHPKISRALVLAPRLSIRNQLAQELAGSRGFFVKCGYKSDTLPKRVVRLDAKEDIPQRLPKDTIFVATTQLLSKLFSESDPAYLRLSAACDAVIVDEGHYEPAPSWSLAIRGLRRPAVLVTATPYRNDLKSFELDGRALHISRYQDLASAHILRPLDVVQVDPSSTVSPTVFVESVLTAFVAKYGEPPTSTRKLIIRCRTRDQIRHLGDLIRRHRFGVGGVLCLHENFKVQRNRPWEKRHPTDPEVDGSPAIWIHQHKLLEGVDGPSFRALAFYGVVGSARALVQQVGRVVRNPARDKTENALMIDHSDGLLQGMWNSYRAYDAQVTADSLRLGVKEVADAFDLNQPPIIYADRQFRKKLLFSESEEVDVRQSLRLPARCHLYRVRANATLEDLAESTVRRLREAEYPMAVITSNRQQLVILFAKIQTSSLLAEHYFVERELHVFAAQKVDSVIAVLDSSRAGLCIEAIDRVGKPLSRAALARLLNGSPELRLVQIAARNASIGLSSVRRRTASAASLEAAPPSLDEFQYVASAIVAVDQRRQGGAVDSFAMRSVGFSRGRVTDSDSGIGLKKWLEWTREIIRVSADQGQKAPQYLDRFAHPLEVPPRAPWPRTVLVDFEDARDEFVFVSDEGVAESIEVDDACLELTTVAHHPEAPRSIAIRVNGMTCAGTFEYDRVRERYILVSEDLAKHHRPKDGVRGGNIVDFLNARQSFLVLPDTKNVIYAEGGFYDPHLKTGVSFDPDALGLSNVVVHHAGLRACTSEKGSPGSAQANGWAVNSVFRWIDENVDDLLPNAELVVCDDGTKESCDFLLAGERDGRYVVVMVHAKASKARSFVAASKLHDISSQAVKQVGTLALFDPKKPAHAGKWAGKWVGPSKEGTVDSRVRRARGRWAGCTGPQIWSELSQVLTRQDTEREVAVVLGASLDRQRLFAQLRQTNTPGPAICVLHLIRSTMASIAGSGARLRIHCG